MRNKRNKKEKEKTKTNRRQSTGKRMTKRRQTQEKKVGKDLWAPRKIKQNRTHGSHQQQSKTGDYAQKVLAAIAI